MWRSGPEGSTIGAPSTCTVSPSPAPRGVKGACQTDTSCDGPARPIAGVAGLRWSEIDFDRAVVTLPPERTKNRRTHEIPLAPAGDAHYPAFDRAEWVEERREPREGFVIVWWRRAAGGSAPVLA